MEVGLTGGIGSGKTTASKIFEAIGIPVFYSDVEAKRQYFVPHIKQQIEALLGDTAYINDEELNLPLLRKIFTDQSLVAQINKIIHPATRKAYNHWHNQQSSHYTINEAAILFETGAYKSFDKTILVVAPEKIRLARVVHRDHSTEEEVQRRMNLQWPDEEKLKLSDYIIDNDGDKSIIKQVLNIHTSLSHITD